MAILRFFADFIEKKLTPIGLRDFIRCVPFWVRFEYGHGISTLALSWSLTVYALGKTFFWPTMLAVVGDRFPRTGAVAMSIMGGIGMMSAGLIGSPGLGYAKDRFAGEALQTANEAAYAEYKSESPASSSSSINGLTEAATAIQGK